MTASRLTQPQDLPSTNNANKHAAHVKQQAKTIKWWVQSLDWITLTAFSGWSAIKGTGFDCGFIHSSAVNTQALWSPVERFATLVSLAPEPWIIARLNQCSDKAACCRACKPCCWQAIRIHDAYTVSILRSDAFHVQAEWPMEHLLLKRMLQYSRWLTRHLHIGNILKWCGAYICDLPKAPLAPIGWNPEMGTWAKHVSVAKPNDGADRSWCFGDN